MATTENKGIMNESIPQRLVYETLNSLNPCQTRCERATLFNAAFNRNKLKEFEICYKLKLEEISNSIINAMKISAKYHGLDFETTPVTKLKDLIFKDYNEYLLEFSKHVNNMCDYDRRFSFKPIFSTIPIEYIKYINSIDNAITSLRTTIKSVEAKEDILNTPTYIGVLDRIDWRCFDSFSDEQEKLIKEGKDIFSKDIISLGIKKLSTFKSRIQRHFNHYFGKDSYFGPLNLLDIYSK